MDDILWGVFVGICLFGSFYFMALSYVNSRRIAKERRIVNAIERIHKEEQDND